MMMERPTCWILKICLFLWVSGLGSLEGQSFNPWANKEGREEMILIHEGQEAKAIKHYEDRLASDSDRQEALFGLTVAHARLGHADNSISFLDRALESGLPFERFLAGPRDLLQPLYTFDAFQKRKARWIPVLLHGPMVGGLTDRSARFWVRTSQSSRVEVLLRADGERFPKRPLITPEVWTQPSTDHTAVMEIHGLKPGQKYHYQVRMDGAIVSDGHAFMTFPRMHRPSDFTVAFGGGAAYTPEFERVFTTIKSRQPIAFIQLGDNIYVDQPEKPSIQRYGYYRRQSSAPYRSLVSNVNVASIWDDHDFGDDDCWYGGDPNQPRFKREVWKVFRENWNNHAYGLGQENPGCYHDFYIGDVHFILLDGRYYRTDPTNASGRSMLGQTQLDWLLKTLEHSKGTFKILASPVPFAKGVKPGSRDPWDGYPEERSRIFAHIQDHHIEGVLLMAADRHRSDLWKIEAEGGYPLYEFMSSRLTNIHVHPVMKGSLFGYNAKRSFGLLEFETTLKDPRATYRIVTIDDEEVYRHSVHLSELSF
ncbi:MAG TPA: alkaline phosphatase [Verrucomicrobiales bacterium]|jgi:alkaline phosphatase D|nr:alkaline phosphatase [Pedosphaera sp.]MAN30009.1 alkaline phosphatase [Pedosphaera sp.]HBF04293.1 alkaline phosphatase [Verrucomicrobiales bacterium]HCB99091.1 alkaline phosphatase [Verrucomicrobiales bacterium]